MHCRHAMLHRWTLRRAGSRRVYHKRCKWEEKAAGLQQPQLLLAGRSLCPGLLPHHVCCLQSYRESTRPVPIPRTPQAGRAPSPEAVGTEQAGGTLGILSFFRYWPCALLHPALSPAPCGSHSQGTQWSTATGPLEGPQGQYRM